MNYKILTLGILVILILSAGATSGDISPIEDNTINLVLKSNAGNQIRMASSLYIKEALKPLGIDITIEFQEFDSFVGDLLHIDGNFDLAILNLKPPGNIPDFDDIYDTDGFFGCYMYQLCDEDVQSQFVSDVDIDLKNEVDPLVFNTNPYYVSQESKHIQSVKQLNQMFFQNLLFDYPLFAEKETISIWNGFSNGETTEFDQQLGIIESSKLGFKWQSDVVSNTRLENDTTFVMRTGEPNQKSMLDTYQVYDISTGDQSELLAGSLLSLDGDQDPHPEIAYQWFVEDATTPDDRIRGLDSPTITTSFKENSRHTFIIDPNFRFSATTDRHGNLIPAHSVDANDVALALDYVLHPNTKVRDYSYKNQIANFTVSTTYTLDDTITIDLYSQSIIDHKLLGGLVPLPSHILGGPLTLSTGETFSLSDFSFDPSDSLEWKYWASPEGNSYAGSYLLSRIDHSNGYWTMTARNDYTFPNEELTTKMYNENSAVFDTLYSERNSTGWGSPNLSTFAPHKSSIQNVPYFWNFSELDITQGADAFPIQHVIYKTILDDKEALLYFEHGNLDSLKSSKFGKDLVQQHVNNPEFQVIDFIPKDMDHTFMVFNLKHDALKKYSVRKAIGMAIDTSSLSEAMPYAYLTPMYSILSPAHTKYYTDEYGLFYDLEQSRQIIQSEGYAVPEYFNSSEDNSEFLPKLPSYIEIHDVLEIDRDYNIVGDESIKDEKLIADVFTQNKKLVFMTISSVIFIVAIKFYRKFTKY